ncbi:hypothetical protein ABEB36_008526 [Hypothenemus hampei]|uniref:Synaptic plasticity regulator PANTS n=1 Tax=Hypothenemus hampei TaxID=57062 RepID=A0ABD1EPE1_HYPHA
MSDPENTAKQEQIENEWMIKQCFVYDEEYNDCTSIKARFNQLFIFGKTIDCGQWKRDSINCYKWRDNKDVQAAVSLCKILCNRKLYYKYILQKAVIESEKNRKNERLLAHYKNNVWTKRKTPPENWNAPLPEHMQKEYETTYLYVKSKELKGEIPQSYDPNFKICTIL